MITGAHSVIYSSDPDGDRNFFKDILKFPYVDVGQGWLIFRLPPSEVAVHPFGERSFHELFLMCDDIHAFHKEMVTHKIKCSRIEHEPWGSLIYLTLPGGGKLGVYEPKHASPKADQKAAVAKTKAPSKK